MSGIKPKLIKHQNGYYNINQIVCFYNQQVIHNNYENDYKVIINFSDNINIVIKKLKQKTANSLMSDLKLLFVNASSFNTYIFDLDKYK